MSPRHGQRPANGPVAPTTEADGALRRWLEALPQPSVPPDLALRIARDVPRLPQSHEPARPCAPQPGKTITPVVVPGSALWHRAAWTRSAYRGTAAPARTRPDPRARQTWPGRLAGLAAAAAVVVLILPHGAPRVTGAQLPQALPQNAGHGLAQAAPAPHLLRPPVKRHLPHQPATEPDAPAPTGVFTPAPGDTMASAAAPAAAPVAHAPAVAAAGPIAGPTDGPSGMPAQLGNHAMMGPVLPQGLGLSGGGSAHGGDFGMTPAGAPAAGGGVPH